jgi:hypothetical protein
MLDMKNNRTRTIYFQMTLEHLFLFVIKIKYILKQIHIILNHAIT